MFATPKSLWNRVTHRLLGFKEDINAVYQGNSEQQFRATSVFYICCMANFVVGTLLFLFLIDNFELLGKTANLIFTPIFLTIIVFFTVAIRLLMNGKLALAKLMVVGMAVTIVPIAISITGGFPNSVASTAIMIPIVLSFCLYGGRTSLLTTLALIGFLLAQWVMVFFFDTPFPNFAGDADPELNAMVAIISTLAIACSVLIIFDHSNRKYIQRAEAAMISKSNFLANTSHEIRTPMNGIIGLAEVMMRTTELDSDQRIYMDAIHQSGTALMTVINDILDYSRLDAGRVNIIKEPFNLFTLIHELRTLMTITAADKNIIIKCSYDKDLPQRFLGDAGRIRQILINLLANAIKFTDNGYVSLNVDIVENEQTANIRITVEDTGIGISKDKIASIFERFTQLDSGPTQKYGGTGLGLSISQKLVGLMGGKIGVESEERLGSKFWFDLELPLAAPLIAPVADRIIEPPKIRGEVRKLPPSRPGALIISQNPDIVQSYGATLNKRGFRVFHTGDVKIVRGWIGSQETNAYYRTVLIVDGALGAPVQEQLKAANLQSGKAIVTIGICGGEQMVGNPFFNSMDQLVRTPDELRNFLTKRHSVMA